MTIWTSAGGQRVQVETFFPSMASFEEIVAGGSRPATESFEARARSRWRKQTSG
jgi:hypothetical protein